MTKNNRKLNNLNKKRIKMTQNGWNNDKIGEKRNLHVSQQQNRILIFGYKFPKKDFVELAPISLNIYAEHSKIKPNFFEFF